MYPITTQPGRSYETRSNEYPLRDVASNRTPNTAFHFLPASAELEKADALIVQQKIPHDVRARCGKGNTYIIKDQDGQQVFTAVEDDNCLCRWCCGPQRMFHLTLYNDTNQPVFHFDRHCCRCDCCCCFDCCICEHKLIARDSQGNIVATARQRFHVFHLRLDVQTVDGDVFAKVGGSCCPCRCCFDMKFNILNSDSTEETGSIVKRWIGHRKNFNWDHDNFEVNFPQNSNANQKIALLAAAFLVNFMYFEMS